MLFFFTAIFGLIFAIFSVLKQETKNSLNDLKTHKTAANNANKYLKAVYQYCNEYYQTSTNNKVFKKIDNNGRTWWYYNNTGKLMEYTQRPDMVQNYNSKAIKAKDFKKKWFTLDDYWDDSIFSMNPFFSLNAYHLDDYTMFSDIIEHNEYKKYIWNIKKQRDNGKYDRRWNQYSLMSLDEKENVKKYFKDNNPHNQKIYVKNMRPYQLSGILNPFKANYSGNYEVQYLIRFRKGFYYLDRQRNINEKNIDELWTKWYAISKEEYENLTNLTIDNYFCIGAKEKEQLQDFIERQYDIIKDKIVFENETNELNWDLENAGIKKAFDNEGNFIGEKLSI